MVAARRIVALAALLLTSAATGVDARWPNGSGSRLRVDGALFDDAAEAFGLTPAHGVLLAAICVHETGNRGVRGGARREMFGPCQVHWATWGGALVGAGIAEQPDDLLDRATGVMAAAFVLSELLRVYHTTLRQTVCLYGCGEKAEQWPGCEYADEVFDNVSRAAGELLAGRVMDVVLWRL